MSQLWELHGSQVGKERNDKYNDKYMGKTKTTLLETREYLLSSEIYCKIQFIHAVL